MSEVVEPQAGNAADRESRERPHVLWKAEIQKNFEHFIHHGELCAHCLTESRKGIINPLSSVRKEQKAGHVETPARPLAVTSTDELREARLENNSSTLFTTETRSTRRCTENPLNCGFRIALIEKLFINSKSEIRNRQSAIKGPSVSLW